MNNELINKIINNLHQLQAVEIKPEFLSYLQTVYKETEEALYSKAHIKPSKIKSKSIKLRYKCNVCNLHKYICEDNLDKEIYIYQLWI